MIVMEGLLLVPPERGTIIGRAVWKPRYVVFGTISMAKGQNDSGAENNGKGSSVRKAAVKTPSSKPSLVDLSLDNSDDDGLYISIYKAKGDWDLVSQQPIAAFKTCDIRALAHRKQGPSLPTLMLELKPDPTSEKAKKRRSSRTGGLTAKDPWANILLFRSVPEERYNIYDWQVMMKPQLTPEGSEYSPISPGTAGQFLNFTNPFVRDNKSTTSRAEQQRKPQQNTSSYPHAPRERPSAMISPSPSLRSRRSDLSSQASSQHPPMGFTNAHVQSYSNNLPADLPSPASTSYEPQFIEGWTSAQGRSSALSSHSHTRGNNSIASAIALSPPIASTPPGPRETILDRAFQMRCIPGSERISEKEEDQLSSLARFEALMRDIDEKKQQRQNSVSKETQEWNLDEESEADSDSAEPTMDNDDSDNPDGLDLELSDDDVGIPAEAQKALEYISGRRTPIPTHSRPLSPGPNSPPVPYMNADAIRAFHVADPAQGSGLRPRTGTYTSTRNGSRPPSLVPSRSVSATEVPRVKDVSNSTYNNVKASTDGKEQRRSSASVKRLSFQEFAKRLSSSTSSLLLVQTNASSNSGREGSQRTSSEFDIDNEYKSGLRGGGSDHARDKRCGWRGSVGAFGEGGYL